MNQYESESSQASKEPEAEATAPEVEVKDDAVQDATDALAAAQAKAAEYWDRLLRLQAEMENMKRRAERDVAHAHKFALEKFVKDLLPVVDSFEMALKTPNNEANKALLEGVEMTHKMLLDVLKKQNVKQLDPEGEPFNPEQHEAVSTQPNTEVDPNTVMMVMQKGYLLNERVVRPALVVVSA